MDMTGERRLPGSRDRVWRAFQNVLVLRDCIPGCRSLSDEGSGNFSGTATVEVDRVAMQAAGTIALLDVIEPSSFLIQAEGKVGAAGFGRLSIGVVLEEAAEATLLHYTVTADEPGQDRLTNGRALADPVQQVIARFLDNLTATVAGPTPLAADGLAALASITPSRSFSTVMSARILGFPLFAWVAAGVFFFIVVNLFAA